MLADFVDLWSNLPNWVVVLAAIADFFIVGGFLIWVLMSKTDSTSAVAWCLLIFFLHIIGVLLFIFFGYQHVRRPLNRKRRHRAQYHDPPSPETYSGFTKWVHAPPVQPPEEMTTGLASLASKLGASPVTDGNHVDFFDHGPPAIEAMIEAIRAARHHIHLEFFIFHPDAIGRRVVDELTAKARAGVQVRLLYDAIGTRGLSYRVLKDFHDAGGQSSAFLSISLWRRRFQINMRNHRKILVVDGEVGFVGGLNIGDEYMGRSKYFGPWRDTHLRIRGPGVYDLQRVFVEDWDFAADERIAESEHPNYFKATAGGGTHALQIIDSGPDQDYRAIREVYFAAILKAKRRVWIASPYFVPDAALLEAVRLAAFSGIDVRLLFQGKPDRWMPYFAARYYFTDVMRAGVKIFQYQGGMMHAKVLIIDDEFASVGTANFDNRSMFLNFEVNCLMYSVDATLTLDALFARDFANSRLLDPHEFAKRSFWVRLAENACRLFSPVL
ncbi:MAG: cardiolipin synthase [Planctomycetota bacterium]